MEGGNAQPADLERPNIMSIKSKGGNVMTGQKKCDFKVEKVCQLGVVVKDLDQVVKDWTENFGFGPWTFLELGNMKYASVFVGQVQFELMQPLEGKQQVGAGELFLDFLSKWGDGIHHVAFCVDDVKASVSKLASNGVKVIAQGGSDWAYVQSSAPGSTIFELMLRANYDLIQEKGLPGFLEAKIKERQVNKPG